MKSTYLSKLEFNKILKILEGYCNTYLGKHYVNELSPSNNKSIVQNNLLETNECVSLIYQNGTPSIDNIKDINVYLKILESSGSLSIPAILSLTNIFINAQDLKDYFFNEHIDIEKYSNLNSYFSNLYSNKNVIDLIKNCIIDDNNISDNASENLKKIRKSKQKLEQDIKNKLNSFIHGSSSKYLQENIITIKNDRYVIPVKADYRGMIKGFVHDISSTGSTVFVEPISIFELNNEINNLNIEENIEIEKILQKLSSMFYPYINELKVDLETIGKLDFIFAKAKYSKDINGITPIINDSKKLNLINAKHPLIDKDSVVPLSIELGENFSSLVITGPNTGGKTVTLKTIGLLTCMACSGLNIPASENSSIYVFDEIFADIGDDQSISESLSTFSAHMTNIIEITQNATSNSLILLDELCSGTDPLEGANLAISILEYFSKIGAITVSTTHYQELKQFALIKKGFKNASVEFDIENLKPTYKLLIGIPGKSNAFAISKKLGLNEEIINSASLRLDDNDISFEELLKNIYDDKIEIEKQKNEIHSKLEKIEILQKNLEKDNTKLKIQEKNIIDNAKIEARNILLNAKEESTRIIRELNDISASTQSMTDLNNLRNSLNDSIKKLSVSDSKQADTLSNIDKKDITPNLHVFVTTFNQEGIVISNVNKSNEVQVQIGNLKTKVNIKFLQKSKNTNLPNPKKENNYIKNNVISKSKNAKTEINVIGLNVEEANFVVDKFLDDSILAKLNTVRIVHGKGTGALRKGIHSFLKNNPHVKSFRLGTFGEGEMGVTIVELK